MENAQFLVMHQMKKVWVSLLCCPLHSGKKIGYSHKKTQITFTCNKDSDQALINKYSPHEPKHKWVILQHITKKYLPNITYSYLYCIKIETKRLSSYGQMKKRKKPNQVTLGTSSESGGECHTFLGQDDWGRCSVQCWPLERQGNTTRDASFPDWQFIIKCNTERENRVFLCYFTNNMFSVALIWGHI